jgi:glycosyltransferase involved in cell wall biosynthesis
MTGVDATPMASALCLTKARPDKLRRAVRCFLAQTYANKELLIVHDEDDALTREALAEYEGEATIRIHRVRSGQYAKLGDRRNLSIELARGEYFATWDDDDWYHPERLARQVHAAMTFHKPACLMTHVLVFDSRLGKAYLSQLRVWENSLVCRKSAISPKRRYDSAAIVEDSPLMAALVKDACVFPLTAPQLYVYERHEGNITGDKLGNVLCEWGQKLPRRSAELIAAATSSRVVADGARLLDSEEFLSQLDYMHGVTAMAGGEHTERLRKYLEERD